MLKLGRDWNRLRRKVLLCTGAALVLVIAALYYACSSILVQGFGRVESAIVGRNTLRATDRLREVIEGVGRRDWAVWDDTYKFVQDGNPAFIKSNLQDNTFRDLNLNLLAFVRKDGKVMWSSGFDVRSNRWQSLSPALRKALEPGGALIGVKVGTQPVKGIINTPEGPMVVNALPILTSEEKGPVAGTVVFGRYMDEPEQKRLSTALRLNVDLYPIDRPNLPSDARDAIRHLQQMPPGSSYLEPINDQWVAGYVLIPDLSGSRTLVLRAVLAREIYQEALQSLNSMLLASSVVGVLIVLIMVSLLERLILNRVMQLTDEVNAIPSAGISARVADLGKDELGELAQQINEMLQFAQQSTQKLEESEANARRLALVAKWTDNAVILTDPMGKIVWVNEGFVRLTGYSSEEAIGQTPGKLLQGPDTDPEMVSIMRRSLAENEGFDVEIVNYHKLGTPYWTALEVRPIYGDSGELLYFLAVQNDVTERRRIQEELQGARDAALQASQVKSEFLANMSHEIRTPMNGVIGMSELLLDTRLTTRQKEYASTIRHSAEVLLAILNDILDVSKIEAGKMSLESIEFDLCDVLEEVASLFAPNAHEKGVEMLTNLSPDLGTTYLGDPTRVRQIVANLVGNAVKFTSTGEVEVSAEPCCIESANGIRIAVRDTGPGISAQQHEAIFESFTQADGSTTRQFGGTGLGLTICRQLTKMMGGRITLESELGRGTTFTVELPLPIVAEGRREEMEGGLKGTVVLIIDDNGTNRRMLCDRLEAWGCKVVQAENGEAGLRAAIKNNPALILTDFQMPGMDGLHLVQELREAHLDTPVIMLSSAGPIATEAERQELGIVACLTKPVRQTQLRPTLAIALGHGRVRSQLTNEAGPQRLQRQARILLVEDNDINRRVATKMLERLNCHVTCANDGLEGFERALSDDFDLILMDCQMPKMDGYEATQAIRSHEQSTGKHRTIVAMTANAMQGDREKCLTAGMDDYCSKPIAFTQLTAILAQWLPDHFEAAA